MKKGCLKILWMLGVFLLCVVGIPEQFRAADGDLVQSLSISIGPKGFSPSSGNYLRIKSYVDTGYQTATVRLRIYNRKGKYIFEKKYKNSRGGFIDYKWNGKPCKHNEAGVSSKKYAKNGNYTAEVCVIPADSRLPQSAKSAVFKISSKAPSGKKGLSAAKTVPILTGDMEVDYMAKQILKAAKVKDSQSDREKVRLIYHWMTQYQKHVHYYEGGSFQTYYKLSSSQKKIKSYRKTTDKLFAEGELIYNYDYDLIRRKWCMERRLGVCTDNAAIFKILCNHAGVEAGICSGYYLNRNGTKPPHSWNYAIVDGSTYYYDVDVEIQNYGKGQGDYYWYQKTKAQAKLTHQFVTTD